MVGLRKLLEPQQRNITISMNKPWSCKFHLWFNYTRGPNIIITFTYGSYNQPWPLKHRFVGLLHSNYNCSINFRRQRDCSNSVDNFRQKKRPPGAGNSWRQFSETQSFIKKIVRATENSSPHCTHHLTEVWTIRPRSFAVLTIAKGILEEKFRDVVGDCLIGRWHYMLAFDKGSTLRSGFVKTTVLAHFLSTQ